MAAAAIKLRADDRRIGDGGARRLLHPRAARHFPPDIIAERGWVCIALVHPGAYLKPYRRS